MIIPLQFMTFVTMDKHENGFYLFTFLPVFLIYEQYRVNLRVNLFEG